MCLLDRGYTVDFAGGPVAADRRQDAGATRRTWLPCVTQRAHGFDGVVTRRPTGGCWRGLRSTVVAVTGRVLRTPPVEAGDPAGHHGRRDLRAGARGGWACKEEPSYPTICWRPIRWWLCSSVTVAARVTRIDDADALREAGADTAAGCRSGDAGGRGRSRRAGPLYRGPESPLWRFAVRLRCWIRSYYCM